MGGSIPFTSVCTSKFIIKSIKIIHILWLFSFLDFILCVKVTYILTTQSELPIKKQGVQSQKLLRSSQNQIQSNKKNSNLTQHFLWKIQFFNFDQKIFLLRYFWFLWTFCTFLNKSQNPLKVDEKNNVI